MPIVSRVGAVWWRSFVAGARSGTVPDKKGPLYGAKGPFHGANGPLHDKKGPFHGANGPLHDKKGPLHGAKGPFHGAKGPFHGAKGPLHDKKGPFHGAKGPLHDKKGPVLTVIEKEDVLISSALNHKTCTSRLIHVVSGFWRQEMRTRRTVHREEFALSSEAERKS
ncbi:MAG: hypothetical protein JST30_07415 [Armatimonadetes bacterium]|nr:hypothetical protein [Armatimonadota bacterium]